ncbi:MAG: glycoside hydrolase family 88 protein [Methanophagales archaeon]|nr:glycoside hydrolase family 88 protein [Methanophagales archaeon]
MNNPKEVYKFALEYALKEIEKNMEELTDSFPFITVNGKWELCKEEDWDLEIFKDGYWCKSFWIGMLWLAYRVTQNDKIKMKAYELCKLIESRKNSNKTHDLGVLFYPSFCVGYEITKDNYLKSVALTAADSLLSRFNDKIGAITVSGDLKESGLTAIDTMMNLPLLWWAYERTDDIGYYNAAYKHASTTMQHFVRDDGSTYHVVEFDTNNGLPLRKTTLQGYNDESCWSRGLAWAIYGFALAYKYAKKNEFLITAEKLADYYLVNCPSDHVPYWDFNDTDMPNTVRDSSAAVITACGLPELFRVSGERRFKSIASSILNSLCKYYLAEEDKDGILKHGCFNKPEGKGVDESLIWGDYYFVEALTKVIYS